MRVYKWARASNSNICSSIPLKFPGSPVSGNCFLRKPTCRVFHCHHFPWMPSRLFNNCHVIISSSTPSTAKLAVWQSRKEVVPNGRVREGQEHVRRELRMFGCIRDSLAKRNLSVKGVFQTPALRTRTVCLFVGSLFPPSTDRFVFSWVSYKMSVKHEIPNGPHRVSVFLCRLSLGYDLFIYLLLASPSFDSEGPEYYRQCQCCPVFFMLERIAAGFVCIDIIRYFLDNIE